MYEKKLNNLLGGAQELIAVDFWASWCPQSVQMAKNLDKISHETGIPVLRIDVDKDPELAQQYGIVNVPALLFFKNGKMVREVSGLLPAKDIKKLFSV